MPGPSFDFTPPRPSSYAAQTDQAGGLNLLQRCSAISNSDPARRIFYPRLHPHRRRPHVVNICSLVPDTLPVTCWSTTRCCCPSRRLINTTKSLGNQHLPTWVVLPPWLDCTRAEPSILDHLTHDKHTRTWPGLVSRPDSHHCRLSRLDCFRDRCLANL